MTSVEPSTPAHSDSFDWEGLMLFIADGDVIPVVGRELLVMEIDGEDVLFERYLAGRLAAKLELEDEQLSADLDLNDVVVHHLSRSEDRETEKRKIHAWISRFVQQGLDEGRLSIPDPLRKLAQITDFSLFVSTTFDGFLRTAVEEERSDQRVESRAYYMSSDYQDLPDDHASPGRTIVYQIFGRLESKTDYVITDEDGLEVLHRLQDERRRPSLLFDELREKNLLFLGCGLPDGLARFLIRTLANEPLGTAKRSYKIADEEAKRNAPLALFLRGCKKAELYSLGNAIEFVDGLYEAWREGREATPSGSADEDRKVDPRPRLEPPEQGSIFLSYKREDEALVKKLAQALQDDGLRVWLDQADIPGGARWEDEIRKNIKDCVLFLPCVSSHAQVAEGVLVQEWDMALERRKAISRAIPFIVPILLDDTRPGAELIPESFWDYEHIECPGGAVSGKTLAELKSIMRKAQKYRRATGA